jgi:hypothetical protein
MSVLINKVKSEKIAKGQLLFEHPATKVKEKSPQGNKKPVKKILEPETEKELEQLYDTILGLVTNGEYWSTVSDVALKMASELILKEFENRVNKAKG